MLVQHLAVSPASAQTPVTFHVDCSNGNNSNNGKSPSSAWKTIDRANRADIKPGDRLLLKRGCTWNEPLKAGWNGTASSPILISAYGNGDLPKIQNTSGANVRISGSHQIVEFLESWHGPNSYDHIDSTCGQPMGWRVGFSFKGASNNTLRNSVAKGSSVGINFTDNTKNNRVLNSRITGNIGGWTNNGGKINGASAVMLHGNGNEIAFNHFEGNQMLCRAPGITIQLYNATNSNVHHNTSYDRKFMEAGSGRVTSANNTFAYNVHASSAKGASFVVTRGPGHNFGPVWETRLFNNSVFLSGENSQGVVCGKCRTDVLTMRNNILVVTQKAIYINEAGSMNESHNIFWRLDGRTGHHEFTQNWTIADSSQKVAPKYVNPDAGDLHVQDTSPAINSGTSASVNAGYQADIDQQPVPNGSAVEIGVDERSGGGSRDSADEGAPEETSPTAVALPGRIEAEDYASGGEGVGYHDTTSDNLGGAYRNDAVDVQPCSDSTTPEGEQCYNVGWPAEGEWLAYDVEAPANGTYQFKVRVASIYGGMSFHIELDGQNVTGSISVPNTGDWQTWTDVTSNPVNIAAGRHTLKIVAETSGYNVNYIDVIGS